MVKHLYSKINWLWDFAVPCHCGLVCCAASLHAQSNASHFHKAAIAALNCGKSWPLLWYHSHYRWFHEFHYPSVFLQCLPIWFVLHYLLGKASLSVVYLPMVWISPLSIIYCYFLAILQQPTGILLWNLAYIYISHSLLFVATPVLSHLCSQGFCRSMQCSETSVLFFSPMLCNSHFKAHGIILCFEHLRGLKL